MKKIALFISFAVFLLVGCSGTETTAETKQETTAETAKETTAEVKETTEAKTTEPAKEVQKLSMGEFDELLASLPVSIVNTAYIVQDEEYKSLYPDMLSTVIQNNTDADIKDVVIGIVAWDSNNLPVKLIGSMDYSDGAYFKQVNYGDINLVGGGTFGETSGFLISDTCKVTTFKPIVLSFETFDGDKWENQYMESFAQAYEGKKFSDDIMIETELKDNAFVKSENSSGTLVDSASSEKFEAALSSQPVFVTSTKYVVQHDQHKSLYPDMLQAILQNNSEDDIRDAVIAYVAWDSNGLPVKIKGQMSYDDPTYVTEVTFNDINLVPGGTYGEAQGYAIDELCGVESFKAIVVSYTTFEDKTWENPEYKSFCDLYEGKKMAQ